MPLFQSILKKSCQIFITLLLVSRTETYIYNTMCLLLTQILEARFVNAKEKNRAKLLVGIYSQLSNAQAKANYSRLTEINSRY